MGACRSARSRVRASRRAPIPTGPRSRRWPLSRGKPQALDDKLVAPAVSRNEGRRSMKVRRIRADEGLALRALRLAALADSPMAYGSTFAREDAYSEALWHARGAAGGDTVTIVAEQDGRLTAMATGLAAGPEA